MDEPIAVERIPPEIGSPQRPRLASPEAEPLSPASLSDPNGLLAGEEGLGMGVNVDFIRQLSALDGILAGFSLATAARLISDKNRSPLAAATVGALLLATLVLVDSVFLALLVGSRAPAQSATTPSNQDILTSLGYLTWYLSLGGLLLYFAGTAIGSWLWSRRVGITTTVAVVLCLGVAIYAWVKLPS